MPAAHQLHPHYSRRWADDVIRTWEKSCPRGWNFLQEDLHITHDQLVQLLAFGRPEWPQLRLMGKQFDRWCEKQASVGIPVETPGIRTTLKDGIIQMFRKKIEPGLYSYLTSQI